MRIRTIKPEFYTHEALFDAEKETGLPLRLAFTGLWCASDREGRFKWKPRRLGVQILPYDEIDFSRVLDALSTRGFIVKYASGTEEFGVIPSFSKHQVINNREKASELPEPPKINDSDACVTRGLRVNHACKGEGKGREGKGKDISLPDSNESDDNKSFLSHLWSMTPEQGRRRSSKKQVSDAWKRIKAKDRPQASEAIDAMTRWKACEHWQKDGGEYVPGLHRWIQNRQWENAPRALQATAKAQDDGPENWKSAFSDVYPIGQPPLRWSYLSDSQKKEVIEQLKMQKTQ